MPVSTPSLPCKRKLMEQQGICIVEGCTNKQTHKQRRENGTIVYRKKCAKHHKGINYRKRQQWYQRQTYKNAMKKSSCEICGFIPEHSCQLDLDHIDGNSKNDVPENYQTLCANCHRLKTYKQGDHRTKTFVPDTPSFIFRGHYVS